MWAKTITTEGVLIGRGRLLGRLMFVRLTGTCLSIVAALLVLATTLNAEAQQTTKGPRIGVLWGGSPGPDRRLEAFRAGLRELGYLEGENVTILHRFAEGRDDRLPALAAELVRLRVNVIVADGTRPIHAAKEATKTIPIVMASAGDPVQSGFVASLSRPGGNITGLANIIRELNRKRLELLKDLAGSASRVVVLYSKGVYDDAALSEVRQAARTLRMEPQFLGARGPEVLGADFRLSDAPQGSVLLVLSDAVLFAHRSRIVDLAAKGRLPAVYTHSGWVQAGGLMSYGTDFADLMRRAAYFVDKVVRGAKPADLPIEQPTKFELVINKQTAHALGLTISSALLVRADQIVE